jgi:hypothetical protein
MPARTPETVIDRVLTLLQLRGQQGCTREDVRSLTGSYSAPSVINRLRFQGWKIHTDKIKVRAGDGRVVHVSRYTLVGRIED